MVYRESIKKTKWLAALAISVFICDGLISHAQQPQRLVFDARHAEETSGGVFNSLYAVDDKGEGQQPLLSAAECDILRYCTASELLPSPNRQYVAFYDRSPQKNYEMNLYVVGGAFEKPKIVAENTLQPNQLSWSPDSKQLAYVSKEPQRRVYIYTLKTGVSELLHSGDAPTSDPYWSPDGKYLAYQVRSQPPVLHITIVDSKTTTFTIPYGTFAAWSPDGRQFSFWDAPPDLYDPGYPDLKIMGVDGTNQRVVLSSRTNNVDWSPDGKHLAYQVAKDDAAYPCMLTLETGQEICLDLGTRAFFDAGPFWSPDSKKLAFTARTYVFHGIQIFIVNADGSDLKMVEGSSDAGFFLWW
jgi:Tol biopolymer transport system component